METVSKAWSRCAASNSTSHYQGVFYWNGKENSDVVYVGDWAEGSRCGQGTCTWSTGDSYTGGWVNEKATGEGGK